jgi:undecaprenyl-diphosphatase
MLLGVLVVVGGLWVFVRIADAMREAKTQSFDDWVLLALRKPGDPSTPIGPWWVKEVARDLTGLGGMTVLGLIVTAAALFLAICRAFHAMLFLLAATLGGLAINVLLKESFGRERPNLVQHLSDVMTSSFPSGHSLMSSVVYLTIGTLLARLVERPVLKVYIISVALVLTFLVGVSRVFMGVHYPTDVLAGWTAGLTWAILCWLVARWLQRRGAVEQSVEADMERSTCP